MSSLKTTFFLLTITFVIRTRHFCIAALKKEIKNKNTRIRLHWKFYTEAREFSDCVETTFKSAVRTLN